MRSGVPSAALHPALPLALDCHSLAEASLARVDRSWQGWKKDRMGGQTKEEARCHALG